MDINGTNQILLQAHSIRVLQRCSEGFHFQMKYHIASMSVTSREDEGSPGYEIDVFEAKLKNE